MGMETIDTAEQDRADMERLAEGRDAALNTLMERHAGPVYQFLFRMLNDEEEANDLAQETFTRVYRHRERYDGGKFTTWLYTIASNLARNEYRRRGRHPNVSLEAECGEEGGTLGETLKSNVAEPAEEADTGERRLAVQRAVDELPTELKEAVVLCEWEEMSAADAAKVLNTTARGVESRLYRARQRLRVQLSKWLS
jgi:RNA polymerase sigma-70 factor (ECF subfamily)